MRHSNNICSTLRLPHRNQHSTLSANQKFITMPKICVELWNYENTDKICLSLSICILYSILLYCMNIHLFNIVIFIFYIRWPFPSFGWFLNRSVIFKWIHTLAHTHIVNRQRTFQWNYPSFFICRHKYQVFMFPRALKPYYFMSP